MSSSHQKKTESNAGNEMGDGAKALDGLGFAPQLRPNFVSEATLERRRQEMAKKVQGEKHERLRAKKALAETAAAARKAAREGEPPGVEPGGGLKSSSEAKSDGSGKPGGGAKPGIDDNYSHKYYCGVCELYEVSEETLQLHQRKHAECAHPGGSVVGAPQVLQSHFDFAHGMYAAPAYHIVDMRLAPTTEVAAFQILAGEDPTLPEEWLWERRTRFPIRARLAELEATEARKQARLDRLEARQLAVALGTNPGRKERDAKMTSARRGRDNSCDLPPRGA